MLRINPQVNAAPRVAGSLCEWGLKKNGQNGRRKLADAERKLLAGFREAAGKTPLLKLDIPVPNGNAIYAKCEFQNPTGSHYDRVYPCLIEILLSTGFTPDRYGLVETSSGNASAAFARVCNALGYDCWVVLPRAQELSEARLSLTSSEGARLVHPEPGIDGYGLPGIAKRMLRLIRESRGWGRPLWSPNHSTVSETADCMLPVAKEIAEELHAAPDYFIAIPGNGTTLYGIGSPLKGAFPGMKIVAVEPYSNPGLYLLKYPEQKAAYAARGELPKLEPSPGGTHEYHLPMPGSGCYGLAEAFPHILASVPLVDAVRQVDDKNCEWDKPVCKGKSVNDLLHEAHGIRVGRTSAASLMAALEIAETVRDKNFVLVFYDLLQGRY